MWWTLFALYLLVASAIWAAEKSWETFAMGLLWPVLAAIVVIGIVFE